MLNEMTESVPATSKHQPLLSRCQSVKQFTNWKKKSIQHRPPLLRLPIQYFTPKIPHKDKIILPQQEHMQGITNINQRKSKEKTLVYRDNKTKLKISKNPENNIHSKANSPQSINSLQKNKDKKANTKYKDHNNDKQRCKRIQSHKKNKIHYDIKLLLDKLNVLAKKEQLGDIENIMVALQNIQFDSKQLYQMYDILTSINNTIVFSNEIVTKHILKSMCSEVCLKNIQLFMLQCAHSSMMADGMDEKFKSSVEILLNLYMLSLNMLSCDILPFLNRSMVFIHNLISRMGVKLNMQEYKVKTRNIIDKISEKIKKNEIEKEEVSELEIAGVKAMSVVPTVNDIFGEPPQIKKNIIEGAYKNADHYLTVQFKLLHEDFITPLRLGINDYIHNRFEPKKSGIAIYKHVKIVKSTIESGKFSHVVKLESNVNWLFVSKFFIYGSLLLFTTNNFQSFFLGTVITVDNRKQVIVVKLNNMHNIICKDIYLEDFTMAASKVFFEPYYHVLTALQSMKSNEFPMETYIVQANKHTKPPAYLKDLNITSYTIYENEDVSIMNPVWPTFLSVKLNQSQLRALQAALTNEFVAIQGPPGTGKTFIAHQIVRILLDNIVRHIKPILVVCYKNHALDQFLEGILDKTENVIRIGGRSKSEKLEKLNITQHRKNHFYGYSEHENVLKDIARSYFEANRHLNELKMHGIMSLDNLLPYISCPIFKENILDIDYVEWLMEGSQIDEEIDVLDEIDLELDQTSQATKWSAFSGDINTNHDKIQSEESTKRLENNFIDDYGNIYNDVLKEFSNINCDDSDEETLKVCHNDNLVPIFTKTIRQLKNVCLSNEMEIKNISGVGDYPSDSKTCDKDIPEEKKEELILQYNKNICYLKTNISFLKRMLSKTFSSSENDINKLYKLGQINIWSLTTNQRWELYDCWVKKLGYDIKKNMIELEELMREEEECLDKARNAMDLSILRKADVIGITTTAAARLRPMLNELGPQIVIVEEAAEVLESHIVTAISKKCEHLILIGDHKQLRPNPAVYKLCKNFNFDVSLFERMIKNGLNCYTLNVQHRMRPEFASLIVPTVYSVLSNHQSTVNRLNIKGLSQNLYFINHNHLENQLIESTSHENSFEAKYVVSLARYIHLQGYCQEEITILTTYNGQVGKIKKIMDGMLPNLRISTVDDFQGEENKIIILSLVRNNEERSIGFLKTENRVCVALSRARDGLYIIGNIDFLAENGEIWMKIKETLTNQKSIGDALPIFCQNHPSRISFVKDQTGFDSLPEGGCKLICNATLHCGHICEYYCHPRDQSHTSYYICQRPCERKICERNHHCPDICGKKCEPCKVSVKHQLSCGHTIIGVCSYDREKLFCTQEIPIVFACGHDSYRFCYQNEEQVLKDGCKKQCGKPLPCKHSCVNKCGNVKSHSCTKECKKKVPINLECSHDFEVFCHEIYPVNKFADSHKLKAIHCKKTVEKILNCGHKKEMHCFEPILKAKCMEEVAKKLSCGGEIVTECHRPLSSLSCSNHMCSKLLPCGHPCNRLCGELCSCDVYFEKILPLCGHKVKYKCGLNDYTKCEEACQRLLPCGHLCKGTCGKPCQQKCEVTVQSEVLPSCGHGPVSAPCYLNRKGVLDKEVEQELSKYCSDKCNATLTCGHQCSGTCNMCSSRKVHAVCNQPCSRILSCNHLCPLSCSEECGPCFAVCPNRCDHRRCENLCGDICDPCNESCNWQCQHQKCTRPCFNYCNRLPCNYPCPKPLPCGHSCVGFCGEVCPSLCFKCNPESSPAENGSMDFRFVTLEDCGHNVDAAYLDDIFRYTTSTLVRCSVETCQKPIIMTKRYKNKVRSILTNIMRNKTILKQKLQGSDQNNCMLQNQRNLGTSDPRYNSNYLKGRKNMSVDKAIRNHSSTTKKECVLQHKRGTNIITKGSHNLNFLKNTSPNDNCGVHGKRFPQDLQNLERPVGRGGENNVSPPTKPSSLFLIGRPDNILAPQKPISAQKRDDNLKYLDSSTESVFHGSMRIRGSNSRGRGHISLGRKGRRNNVNPPTKQDSLLHSSGSPETILASKNPISAQKRDYNLINLDSSTESVFHGSMRMRGSNSRIRGYSLGRRGRENGL